MGIFQSLGQQMPSQRSQQDAMQSMRNEVGQISSNPGKYLKAKGYDIPDGMTDAREITQYLLQTGQVGVPRLRQVVQMFGGGRR